MSLQAEIDAKRLEIHTEGYPMSVGELLNLYRDDELDIHPEFQRFFRWSDSQKSRFIESLLLGIPVPSIFVNQRHDGVWDVIDGLQRLSTIFEFVGLLVGEDGAAVAPLKLEGTRYLPSLEGVEWAPENGGTALGPALQRIIKRAAIDVKIITRESDSDAKFDLFQRLNTGGSQLSDQEVRNCLLIMQNPEYYRWVISLRASTDFQDTVAPSDRAIDEQYDMELVLRFMALKDAADHELRSLGDMKDFLDESSLAAALDGKDRSADELDFARTFELLNAALGDEAFRRYDAAKGRFLGGFSVSAFEAITAGVHAHIDGWIAMGPAAYKPELRSRAQALWSDQEFRGNSGSGFRASTRIPKTVPRGRALFTP